jgi:ribosomal protein S18 acetylase RimI-like enzyme
MGPMAHARNLEITVRRATEADLPVLGRLGALLMRKHYAFDRERFMAPGDNPEEGYAWFLGTQLHESDVAIFVADHEGTVLGYVYAAVEPQSWKDLREEAGFVHDLVVDDGSRRSGVARALMLVAQKWLRSRGMPRVVLGTATANVAARHLFASLGFRETMVEMTRELA